MLDLRALSGAAVLALCASLSCTPDTFSYDEPGASGSGGGGANTQTDCDDDSTCVPACPAGTTRSAQGVCEKSCGPWQLTLDFAVPEGLTASAGRLFAVGTSSADDGRPEQAQLTPIDACSGATTDSVLPLGPVASIAGGVSALAGSVFTVGTASADTGSEVVVVELDATTLAKKSSSALPALPQSPLALGVATDSGGVWVVGRGGAPGSYVPWLARATSAGACSVSLPGAGEARAVGALSDGAVAVIGRTDATVGLVRVDGACAPAPSLEVSPVPNANSVTPNAAATLDRKVLIVGHALVGSDTVGFVAAVDADSGNVDASTNWDVPGGVDGLLAATESAGVLYVGGMAGAESTTKLSTAHATLAAFSLPLAQGAAPTWFVELADIQRIESVSASPTQGVFALGALPEKGSKVIRCDLGGC